MNGIVHWIRSMSGSVILLLVMWRRHCTNKNQRRANTFADVFADSGLA